MNIISPLEFKLAFNQVVSDSTINNDIMTYWNQRKSYTRLIRDRVLPKTACLLNLNAYTEKDYYWLDSIFYKKKDENNFKPHEVYVHYISVAIEHEHVATGTAGEMNKLQLFNTPIKVLITYPKSCDKANELLEKYCKIIQEADIFSDFSSHRKQLVIFGYKGSSVVWDYYSYNGRSFEII